ncbi:hypothetical protein WMY93_024365 [Mugilogobius chulae]|uniref:Ig-like domain-containing protein n=1 Tax=Mugilogobius chulae TaxID=88201 RepID=A0AAW0MZE9_9GOBI
MGVIHYSNVFRSQIDRGRYIRWRSCHSDTVVYSKCDGQPSHHQPEERLRNRADVSVYRHCNSKNVTCRLGHSCVLPCDFQGQLDMVHWTLSPDLSRGNSSLILSDVRLQDQGSYKCTTVSDRGQDSSSMRLRVFAPVLSVSLQQEDEQIVCRSENLYPEPSVSWIPSSLEHNTSVSELGLFTISSSVTLLDSEDEYVCNISTEHAWKTALLIVKEKEFTLNEFSFNQDGLYSCLHNTDAGSVIMRIQVKSKSL